MAQPGEPRFRAAQPHLFAATSGRPGPHRAAPAGRGRLTAEPAPRRVDAGAGGGAPPSDAGPLDARKPARHA